MYGRNGLGKALANFVKRLGTLDKLRNAGGGGTLFLIEDGFSHRESDWRRCDIKLLAPSASDIWVRVSEDPRSLIHITFFRRDAK